MLGEQSDLLEAVRIGQPLDALAGAELAAFVLLFNAALATPELRLLAANAQIGNTLIHCLLRLLGWLSALRSHNFSPIGSTFG